MQPTRLPVSPPQLCVDWLAHLCQPARGFAERQEIAFLQSSTPAGFLPGTEPLDDDKDELLDAAATVPEGTDDYLCGIFRQAIVSVP